MSHNPDDQSMDDGAGYQEGSEQQGQSSHPSGGEHLSTRESSPSSEGGSTWGQDALRTSGGRPVTGSSTPDAEPYGHGSSDNGSPQSSGTPYGGISYRGTRGSKRVGPKPIRPPRFTAGPLVVGLGLLSIVIVIGIMAMLAVKILDSTGSSSVGGGAISRATDNPDDPSGGPDQSSGEISGNSRVDAAVIAACRVNKQTLETAVSVYEAVKGNPPASIDDLIAESLLREDSGSFELREGPDGTEVVGIGDCEATG